MKQIRFSDLPTSSQVNEADVFPIIQNGDNKKAQQSSIKDYSQYKNIPKVNGRALSGNVTLDELGAQAPGEYLSEKELLDADLVTKVENANKADKNYGAENSGKYLGTDENGEIAPIDVKFSDDNKIIKVAQGNPTIIQDSYEGKLKKLNIYGESHQASTTGSQLLNPSLFESDDITKNGIHFIKNSDGSISVSGTATGFSTYNLGLNELQKGTYYINGTKNNTYVYVYIKKTDDERYIENASFTIDGTETSIISYIQINPGFSVNDIIYPMLNLGDTSKPFELYTGGKPSPSPDYPQEIISKEVSSIIVSNGASESQTITLSEPITLRGIPVTSGGNVTIDGQQYISDVIKEKDGVIGVDRNIELLTMTGANSEGWRYNLTIGTIQKEPCFVMSNASKYKSGQLGYCERYIEHSLPITNGQCHMRSAYAGEGRISICDSTFSSLEEWKQHLSENPLKATFLLKEPIFEPLPEEVQAQYKALKSYYPNTVIQTGCWNEVEYEVSLQSFVEDMYEKIKEVNNNNKLLL